MRILKRINLFIILSFLMVSTINAKTIDNSKSLHNVKNVNVAVMVDFTDISTTAFYLNVLEETYDTFKQLNIEPKMVVVFVGKTVTFLSSQQNKQFELENREHLNSIRNSIKKLSDKGIRTEVCAYATKVFNIGNDTLPKESYLVTNGFVSYIGYQAQGYQTLPIFQTP
jgi:intracellular sulfur oxidation DsrE/DsrF family protein